MFSRSSTKRSAERLFDERLYEQVVTELSRGEIRQGLWAKAIADAEGIDEKAKSFYIKYRVQSLKDEWSLAEHEKAQKDENNKRKELQALRERNAILKKNSYILVGISYFHVYFLTSKTLSANVKGF